MNILDLKNTRCPLALIKLKQFLIELGADHKCEIHFSCERAMLDITRYLKLKNFNYKKTMNHSIYILSL